MRLGGASRAGSAAVVNRSAVGVPVARGRTRPRSCGSLHVVAPSLGLRPGASRPPCGHRSGSHRGRMTAALTTPRNNTPGAGRCRSRGQLPRRAVSLLGVHDDLFEVMPMFGPISRGARTTTSGATARPACGTWSPSLGPSSSKARQAHDLSSSVTPGAPAATTLRSSPRPVVSLGPAPERQALRRPMPKVSSVRARRSRAASRSSSKRITPTANPRSSRASRCSRSRRRRAGSS